MAENEKPRVIHNEAEHRFELEGQGGAARLEYVLQQDAIVITHTEVPKALEGHGVAAALAAAGLAFARDRGLRIIPRCPFVAKYIERHPEYQSLVDRA